MRHLAVTSTNAFPILTIGHLGMIHSEGIQVYFVLRFLITVTIL
jgi:hypothetical protein